MTERRDIPLERARFWAAPSCAEPVTIEIAMHDAALMAKALLALHSETAAIVQVLPLAPQPATITTSTHAAPQAGNPGSGTPTLVSSPAAAAPSDDKLHGAYSPLTEHEIQVLREEMLSDDGFLPEGKERVARLCDMAVNALLYAQEIQRFRAMPSAGVARREEVRAAFKKTIESLENVRDVYGITVQPDGTNDPWTRKEICMKAEDVAELYALLFEIAPQSASAALTPDEFASVARFLRIAARREQDETGKWLGHQQKQVDLAIKIEGMNAADRTTPTDG